MALPRYGKVGVRAVASVAGLIVSMSLAVGPVAHLRTRAMYHLVNQCRSWYDSVRLSPDACEELAFWQSHVPFLMGQPIWFGAGVTRVAFSDASDSGYGGYVVELGQEVAHGQWSVTKASQSSTWRELRAVFEVLRAYALKLQGHSVKWFTDNQNVARIVRVVIRSCTSRMEPWLYSRRVCSMPLSSRWSGSRVI